MCRELPGNLCSFISSRGFAVHVLPTVTLPRANADGSPHAQWLEAPRELDAQQTACIVQRERPDWLVFDHYALDARTEAESARFAKRCMVIDDLADRAHACDLLLDQNFYYDAATRYRGLVAPACRQLLGPEFALLRPEFAAHRLGRESRMGHVSRALVFFGAGDVGGGTSLTLEALARLANRKFSVDVVIGVNCRNRDVILNRAAQLPEVQCHEFVDNFAAMMAASDLYIGAAGTTTWERCCIGLPSLVIAVAKNQEVAIRDLALAGTVRLLGTIGDVTAATLTEAIRSAVQNPAALALESRRAMALVDGLGASRCAAALHEIIGETT